MQLVDLTNPRKIQSLVVPSMLGQRDSGQMNNLTVALNEKIANGQLKGFTSGAEFIAKVRDAVIAMPNLGTEPSQNDALNLAVQLIQTMMEHERSKSAMQQGV